VAVKQIKLVDVPKSELRMIEVSKLDWQQGVLVALWQRANRDIIGRNRSFEEPPRQYQAPNKDN